MQSYFAKIMTKGLDIENMDSSSDSSYDDAASHDSAGEVGHIMKKQMASKIRQTLHHMNKDGGGPDGLMILDIQKSLQFKMD